MDNKQKGSPSKQTPLAEAYLIHQDLLDTIEVMDEKINEVIKHHEAEFLLAYRNHIKTMKEELAGIKQKADEQQKKMLSNDRAVYLQKQLILFREQALNLYDKLQQKTQECEHHKSQARDFEKVKNIVQKQNREILKANKTLQAQIGIQQNRINELTQQISQLKYQLQSTKDNAKQLSIGQTLKTSFPFTENIQLPFTPKPKDSLHGTFESKKYSKSKPAQSFQKKLSLYRSSKKKSLEWLDHQLKNWFVDCIQTIRKEVAQRKVYGYKSQDLNAVANWQQFRMIDKLRLLQIFMQNEKLLVWMYEKIFPSRTSEIEDYFTTKKTFQNGQKSKSVNITADHLIFEMPKEAKDVLQQDLNNDHILPKVLPVMQGKKKKLYDVRQRIDMRNGKLNLSSIQSEI